MVFKPGESGNPSGRPAGLKDKRATYREQLEASAPELIDKIVVLALKGDLAALKICIDRILPTLKSVEFIEPNAEEPYESLIKRLARLRTEKESTDDSP